MADVKVDKVRKRNIYPCGISIPSRFQLYRPNHVGRSLTRLKIEQKGNERKEGRKEAQLGSFVSPPVRVDGRNIFFLRETSPFSSQARGGSRSKTATLIQPRVFSPVRRDS